MPIYDDFETKKNTEQLRQRLLMLQNFRDGALPALQEKLDGVTPLISLLASNPERTQEEDEMLSHFLSLVRELSQTAQFMKMVLEEKLAIQSRRFYFHMKDLARQGNARAQEICDDLKDLEEDRFSDN